MAWMERHSEEDNLHRFYETEISRDLFGDWMLVRRWGRTGRGRTGQSKAQTFASLAEAEAAETRILTQKLRRGYVAAAA